MYQTFISHQVVIKHRYTIVLNQSVVSTVVKEVSVRHLSATEDNVKGTCNCPALSE